MAIAFDSQAIGDNTGVSLNNAAGNLLIVTAFNLSSSVNDPSVCTYNSVSLTKLGGVTLNSTLRGSLWYLANPATGTHTLTVTNSTDTLQVVAMTFTGASGVVQNFTSAFNASSPVTTSVTSGSNDMIVAGTQFTTGSGNITGSGLTVPTTADTHRAGGYVQSATAVVGFSSSGSGCYMVAASAVASANNRGGMLPMMGIG